MRAATTTERLNSCCDDGQAAHSSKTIRPMLESYQATRTGTLALVEGLSQAQMDYVPTPGKWSPGEVLDHLLLGERVNLGYIREVIEMKRAGKRPVLRLSFADVDVSIAYLPTSLLQFFAVPLMVMNLFVPRSLRDLMTRYRLIPAQNAALTTPRHGRSAGELRNDLISSLCETLALFDSNSDLDFGEMVIEHPLLGSNNLPELVRFLALHEQRHQSQIKEIMSSPGFPAAVAEVKSR